MYPSPEFDNYKASIAHSNGGDNMSGWQTDARGYRFRDLGNGCREYAGQITTTRGTFDEDRLPHKPATWHDFNSVQEIQRSKQAGQTQGKICPLKASKGLLYGFCADTCTFYGIGGCALSGRATAAQGDTLGKDCPIVGKCSRECALYHHDGCDLRR